MTYVYFPFCFSFALTIDNRYNHNQRGLGYCDFPL
nr:MAG TPA: hypothetical protein [Caudoviricetes sp.]